MALTASGGTLNGVTVNGNLDLTASNANAAVTNGLTLNGTATLGSAARLYFNGGSQTLAGTGTVVFNNATQQGLIANAANMTLTIGAGIAIRGGNNQGNSTYSGSVIGYSGRWSGGSNASVVNLGTISADTSGMSIVVNPNGAFSNQGSLQAPAGTLVVCGSVVVNESNQLSGNIAGTITIRGDLLGNVQCPLLYTPQGLLVLNGSGTASTPQLLEVMGCDVGSNPSGFTRNFAYATLTLANTTYVQLVDQSANTTSGAPEALYVNALVVPAGATLNLNGFHLYTRATQISGTVVGGTISQVPDSGPLALNAVTAGAINPAGQVDQWTIFERAGRSVTVLVDPGSGASSGPLSPALGWVKVQLVGPSGNVLATADNVATGSGAIVTLSGVPLPTDGTYTIQIQAPTGHTAATGDYMVTVWDATPNEFPLNLGQTVTGGIATAAGADHWNFSAVANQQVQFHLVSAAPGIAFRLTGPGGFVGFDSLQGDSPLVTLSASGNYVLTAYGLGGQTGNYAFCLTQTSQTDLTLNAAYNGTLAGSGQVQLFRVDMPAGKFLRVILNDSTSTDSNEVYLKSGSPPTRSDFDYRYSAVGSANQDVCASVRPPGLGMFWFTARRCRRPAITR